ncbi:MAG: LysM peptidoglycan-binding domain-containing protein [Bacteroidales bacterium]|nr:LysM peptidoglycan-binding domain-containing protein [Bacteroidales bacterium]MCF8386976.1 LysM peptidoglycan-binding domain-containing protein [Bacteroidales bacterium]MCF8397013.1 LysM peptidoglycan-binding domain-containing protein [Bacteroidales bacterium]
MKYYCTVLLLLLSAAQLFPQGIEIERSDRIEKINGQDYYIHKVDKGQTLYSIARAYSTSLNDIRENNPDASKELSIGQELKIPFRSFEPEGFEPLSDGKFDFFYHISRAGETFKDVGYIYVIDPRLIKSANPDLREPLKDGEYVKVPVNVSKEISQEPVPKTGRSELVRPGRKEAVSQDTTVPKEKILPLNIPEDTEYTKHVVQKGQTLYRISKLYEVSLGDIREINPGLTPDIAIGQIIRIPGKHEEEILQEESTTEQKTVEDGFVKHEVKKGETLYRIARTYKVSLDSLMLFNKGLKEDLRIGQIINIPVSKENKKYIIHKVEERKEKLHKIAKKYGVQVSDLQEINPEIKRKAYRGQIVRIPVQYEKMPIAKKDTSKQLEIIRIEELPEQDSLLCYANRQENLDHTYKIALMLPFYLEEADSLQWDQLMEENKDVLPAPFRFIQFYEGLKIAMDTLIQQGLKTELYVYDVGTDADATYQILKKPELRDMDLIIGPLFRQNFGIVARFAKLYQINIVNPFTNTPELVENNPFAFKVQPSMEKQIEQVVDFVLQKYPDAKIILVRDNEYRYQDEVNEFFAAFSEYIPWAYTVPNHALQNILVERSQDVFEQLDDAKEEDEEFELLASLKVENMLYPRDVFDTLISDSTIIPNRITEVIYKTDSAQGIINNASVVRDNVIIALTEDKSQMLDILVNLNVLRDTFDIHLFGLPNWDDFAEFEPELYLNLDLHVLAPGFVDYDQEITSCFIKKFRQRFHTEPDYFAFQGFDIGMYFLSALMNFGTDFKDCLPYFSPQMIRGKYVFRNTRKGGHENAYWNIYNYRNYRMVKQPNYHFLNQKPYKTKRERNAFEFFN